MARANDIIELIEGDLPTRKKISKYFSNNGWYTGGPIVRELKPGVFTFYQELEQDGALWSSSDEIKGKNGIIPLFKKGFDVTVTDDMISYGPIKKRGTDQSKYRTVNVDLNKVK